MAFLTTNDGTNLFYKDWGPRDGDVVIAMGAGSIGTVAQTLKDLLEGTR